MGFNRVFRNLLGKFSTAIATFNFQPRFNFSTPIRYFSFYSAIVIFNAQLRLKLSTAIQIFNAQRRFQLSTAIQFFKAQVRLKLSTAIATLNRDSTFQRSTAIPTAIAFSTNHRKLSKSSFQQCLSNWLWLVDSGFHSVSSPLQSSFHWKISGCCCCSASCRFVLALSNFAFFDIASMLSTQMQ